MKIYTVEHGTFSFFEVCKNRTLQLERESYKPMNLKEEGRKKLWAI